MPAKCACKRLNDANALFMKYSALWLWLMLLVPLCTPAQPRMAAMVQNQPLGRSYFQFESVFLDGSEEFAEDGFRRPLFSGERLSDGRFSERLLTLHYEYGLAERLTLVARMGYRFILFTYIDNLDPRLQPSERLFRVEVSGFDDSWLAARYALIRPIVQNEGIGVAVQLGIKFPTGDVTLRVPTGTGYLDYELRLLAESQHKISGIPSYLILDSGFRWRGGEFGNQVPFRVEFGIAAAKELMLRTSLNGIVTLGEFQSPVGIIENFQRNRPIRLVGDESYLQLAIGFELFFTPTFSAYFDYNNRAFGRTSISSNILQFGFILR
ncbi:MAG: hypothetical protein CMR00_06150 [[Chlorobium] sp. 445]|nr:MAG: hypothetical protein CMR00_06150 [[Chlorobium] sp. 445]